MRALSVVLALLLAGCGEPARDPRRELLAFGMKSYDLKRDVVPAWAKEHPVEVLVDASIEPGRTVPSFGTHAVRVGNVSPRSALPGELVISFLDDRLMEVCFFPDDYDAYVAAGKAKPDPAAPSHVAFRTSTDRRGKRYAAWSDSRLVEEAGNETSACE